jgi:hypothetical protein
MADEIDDIVSHVVKESRERVLVPDPKEVLMVRCVWCEKPFMQTRRVIERDNRRYGFFACSKMCRRNKSNEGERIFNPVP